MRVAQRGHLPDKHLGAPGDAHVHDAALDKEGGGGVQITVGVDGMACSMCEAHVSDAIRKAFPVKKVTASHTKGQAVIVAENEIAEADIAKALEPTGYRMVSYSCAPYQKKKLFGIFG